MSNTLNRISLDLVDVQTKMKQEKRKKNRSRSVLDLVPANYKITRAKRKSDQSRSSRGKNEFGVRTNKQSSAKDNDIVVKNIQKLLALSGHYIDQDTADKMFNRAVMKRPVLKDNKTEDEEKTAFTEEDFAKFEKEYLATA